jgi:hypothetical protein
MRHEADYIARTIETVRNHKDADNCWPQWANIFADQIEDQAAALAVVERERDMLREYETCADWYIRCLEDVQDRRPVRGLAEAKAGYDSARDALAARGGDAT